MSWKSGKAHWSPLGYDVCDNVLTSGLLNCGYAGNEVESLVARWGGRLNRWHLFDQVDDAFAFAIMTDARVPERAPFGVFRVYVAESVNVDAAWHKRPFTSGECMSHEFVEADAD